MDTKPNSERANSERPPEPRFPQQARSLATRRRLLDAAADQLISGGYAALTTVEVAQRAGVSRGAFLHHFPTRASLVAATVEHLVEAQMG
jgi:AcrR family transcriptional regulator